MDGTGLPEEAVAVPGSAEPPAARKAFAALTALVTEAQPMTVVLEAVAYLTHHVVPGAAGVSILRPAGDGVTGLVRTAEVAGALDAAQTPGGGPGVHAARTGEVVLVPDARTEDRWPRYAREAVGSGVLSCLAVPIPAVGGAAALTVYGEPAGAFDCAACALVTRFAGSFPGSEKRDGPPKYLETLCTTRACSVACCRATMSSARLSSRTLVIPSSRAK